MELTEYQNLIKFISSGFIDFPEDLADRSTKKGRNQREYYKRRAEKTYFVNGMYLIVEYTKLKKNIFFNSAVSVT